jgi:predicted GNAT family N-acyltransferase
MDTAINKIVTKGNTWIRSIRRGEEEVVCDLIGRSFDQLVGCDYSQEGVTEFYKYANPAAMADRLKAGHFILIAEEMGKIVGMIEFRNGEHVSLLFVDPPYFKMGLSRQLFDRAMLTAREANPAAREITVNSSRYAVPVYQSFGFKTTGPEKTINGITFIPMSLDATDA